MGLFTHQTRWEDSRVLEVRDYLWREYKLDVQLNCYRLINREQYPEECNQFFSVVNEYSYFPLSFYSVQAYSFHLLLFVLLPAIFLCAVLMGATVLYDRYLENNLFTTTEQLLSKLKTAANDLYGIVIDAETINQNDDDLRVLKDMGQEDYPIPTVTMLGNVFNRIGGTRPHLQLIEQLCQRMQHIITKQETAIQQREETFQPRSLANVISMFQQPGDGAKSAIDDVGAYHPHSKQM